MSKRVDKVSKWRIFGALFIIIALMVGYIQPVSAAGEYTIYNVPDDEGDAYYATTATSQSEYDTATDALVYCVNSSRTRPTENTTGLSGYTKTADASDSDISSDISYSDNAKYVRAVLYYGYPNLGGDNAWKTKFTTDNPLLAFPTSDAYLRVYTQAAIWYFTDSEDIGGSQTPIYSLCVLAKTAVDNGTLPSDFSVDLYTSSNAAYQNFIGLHAAESTTTSASIKVNKTWTLSTGGAYTGTRPTVTFKLYEGEGTTGTLLGTQTLGSDDTVTFSSIDTTTVKKFTLVESISGAVSGYTFTPAGNTTVDLTNTANGATYDANIDNTVTETGEETTSAGIKVNKTWTLSTGGAYTGTKPTVTFTLYEGEGTTGTLLGTQTLASDDTVTFSSIDTTTVKKFTLVENISGTVEGYTFAPADNTTLDLTNTANGATYDANIDNTVTETEEEDTAISVKVNKTWKLTSGGTYDGTKPTVTFTLYGGEGTTGTNYGTVTLGDDDTAVFDNIDASDEEKFTLVENISGTVSGYTFTPCDNIVIDMSDISEDNELVAEAVNEVSAEKVKKTDAPDTGDRSDMGLYLVVLAVGAAAAVSLRKYAAK